MSTGPPGIIPFTTQKPSDEGEARSRAMPMPPPAIWSHIVATVCLFAEEKKAKARGYKNVTLETIKTEENHASCAA